MTNPWLDIPEADYVGHMASPAVGQRQVLGCLVGEVLETVRPQCGPRPRLFNGQRIGICQSCRHFTRGRRRYQSEVSASSPRTPNPASEFDVRPGDVADVELEREAYDLVHSGLILEYVPWPVLLPRVAMALRPGGVLSVILQAPSASSPAVTPTAFISLRTLASLFRFVEPTALVDAARGEGLNLTARHTEALPAGKSFEVLRFVKDAV
jgi:hypothetical protein